MFILYKVLHIASKLIYALYGKQKNVIIPLKTAPIYPSILGAKVFCFCSPSFLKITRFIISIIYGNNMQSTSNPICHFKETLKIFSKIIKYTNDKIAKISNKLLLKLSKILYLESKFNFFDFNQPAICQSPLIHLESLLTKLVYFVGYPSINNISVARPHLK